MNCHEVKIYADDYITGRLRPDELAMVEQHLSQCEKCRRELAQDSDIIGLLKTDRIPDPGEKYWADMENSVLLRIAQKPEKTKLTVQPKDSGFLFNLLLPLAAVLAFFLIAHFDYFYDIGFNGEVKTFQIVAKGPSDMTETILTNLPKTRLVGSILMTMPGSAGSQGIIFGNPENRNERN